MGILDAAWLYFLLDFLFPTCLFLYCLCSPPFFLPVSALVLLLLFLSKTIKVKVIDDEEYEKNKAFYIEIGEPHLVESNNKGQKAAGRHDAVTELTLELHVYKESTWRTFSCLSTILMSLAAGCGPSHLTTTTTPARVCVRVCVCVISYLALLLVDHACIHLLYVCTCVSDTGRP